MVLLYRTAYLKGMSKDRANYMTNGHKQDLRKSDRNIFKTRINKYFFLPLEQIGKYNETH